MIKKFYQAWFCTSLLTFSLVTLSLFNQYSLVVYLSLGALVYLSGTLTNQYKPFLKLSITAYCLMIISLISTLFIHLYSIEILNYIVPLTFYVVATLIYLYIHLKMRKKNAVFVNIFSEMTITIQGFPSLLSVALIISANYISIELLQKFFFDGSIDMVMFVISSALHIVIWYFLIAKNLKYLKNNFLNVTPENKRYFIIITTVPIFFVLLAIVGMTMIFAVNNVLIDIFPLVFLGFVFHIIYMRNFAIRYLDKFKSNINTPNGSTLANDSSIIDADFIEID